jgi:hypothetical protein
LTGLVVIMFGVRRRLRLAGQSLSSEASSANS